MDLLLLLNIRFFFSFLPPTLSSFHILFIHRQPKNKVERKIGFIIEGKVDFRDLNKIDLRRFEYIFIKQKIVFFS